MRDKITSIRLTVLLAGVIEPSFSSEGRQRCGEMHSAAAVSVKCATDLGCPFGVYKQRLTEVSVDDEVKVLLEKYLVVCVIEQVITTTVGPSLRANVYSGWASAR